MCVCGRQSTYHHKGSHQHRGTVAEGAGTLLTGAVLSERERERERENKKLAAKALKLNFEILHQERASIKGRN